MLRLLRIRNFAIIDQLELEFEPGFNAITGETGAGKSIILDAIGLILGNRANADLIRTGAEEATVEALFDIGSNEAVTKRLVDSGLDPVKNGDELLVKRSVHRNGKNKIFINGELVTLSQLAELCENLVELCSQHEHQSLSKTAFQLDLLDRYGGLLEQRRKIRDLYSAVRSCENELDMLTGGDGSQARTEDFLRFQLTEIDEFNPKEDEEESLQNERKRLLHATSILDNVNQANGFLDASGSDVRTLLGKSIARLNKAAEMDETLVPTIEALNRAQLEVDEATAQLASYVESLEVDPNRAEEVEERLMKWSMMKKKYGPDAAEIIRMRDQIEKELHNIEHRDSLIQEVRDRLETLNADFEKAAGDLSKKRKNVAKTLAKTIVTELSELSMPGTRFEVEFEKTGFGADGYDHIQFLFSPNPGEELKPVSKIASGGELSRVLLAIRRTIADRGGIGVYLFDEIDAGIGGQTASVVGSKIRSVSKYNQIICITHLPQVAAYAGAHFHVSKKVTAGRTTSEIHSLKGNHRIDELARMLGGMNVTEKSRAHARDLLQEAKA